MTLISSSRIGSWPAALLAFSLLAPGAALGQEVSQACPIAADQDEEDRQLSGTIVRTETLPIRGTDQRAIVAWVSTGPGEEPIAVDLGPADDLEGIELSPNTQIAVDGRVHSVREDQLLVATRVRSGDQMVQIDREAEERQYVARQQRRQEQLAQREERQAEQDQRQAQRQEQQAADEPVDVYLTESDEPADLDVAIVEDDPDLRVRLGEEDLEEAS